MKNTTHSTSGKIVKFALENGEIVRFWGSAEVSIAVPTVSPDYIKVPSIEVHEMMRTPGSPVYFWDKLTKSWQIIGHCDIMPVVK